MRILIAFGMLIATTIAAYASAPPAAVPEIDAFSGMAAMGVVQSPRLSGSAAGANKGGLTMRIWISVGILIASTVGAYAQTSAVPEIDAFSGMAAMGVVGSIAVLIWERRRRK